MVTSVGPAGGRGCYCCYRPRVRGGHRSARRRGRIGLVDGRARGLAAERSRYPNLHFALESVGPQPVCHGPPLVIGEDRQGTRSIGEGSAGALGRQREHHHRAGHRLMVFVLQLHDRLAGGALANVVDRALALHHYDIQRRRRRLGLQLPERQADRQPEHRSS